MNRRGVRALLSGRAGLRWMHLLLGAGLLMPFQLLTTTTVDASGLASSSRFALEPQLLALALDLPLVAAVGLLPVTRSLEGAMARTLCGATGEVLASPAHTWSARRRTSAWFTLHTLLGGLTGAVTLAMPPAGALLLLLPLVERSGREPAWAHRLVPHLWAAPTLGLCLLALPVLVSHAAGGWLTRLAPRLLGPTLADRLADAQQRANAMAQCNRVARELHDSVGHALSVVSLQAAAAGRLLRADPAFATAALSAIEQTAHDAVAELDRVLGLLRDGKHRTPPPTLDDLPALLDRTRAAGASVDCDDDRTGSAMPSGPLSQEAYRIVQEGLGNALKHAQGAPIQIRLTSRKTLGDHRGEPTEAARALGRRPSRAGGGNGLTGMRERVRLLRGTLYAGPDDSGQWRLTACLPLGSNR
ncbi:sensor histidine kinase [Streptacidiphilus monticola]